jgi:hypothetical protein
MVKQERDDLVIRMEESRPNKKPLNTSYQQNAESGNERQLRSENSQKDKKIQEQNKVI